MQIKKTSEIFTNSIIFMFTKNKESEYVKRLVKGSYLESEYLDREFYLGKGTFIFLLSSLILAFIAIGAIAILSYSGIINYFLFLIIYFPFFFVLSIGTFFNYFRARTRLGFIESFDKSHLVISVIAGFICSSILASTPFI